MTALPNEPTLTEISLQLREFRLDVLTRFDQTIGLQFDIQRRIDSLFSELVAMRAEHNGHTHD